MLRPAFLLLAGAALTVLLTVVAADRVEIPAAELRGLDRDVKTLRALASAELQFGRGEAALTLLERALNVQISEVGEHNETVVDLLAEIASAHLWLDDDVSALQMANRALVVLDQTEGISKTARIAPNAALSEIFISAGDYGRAEKLLDEAREIGREHLDRGYIQTFDVFSALTLLKLAQGKNSDAEQIARETLTSLVEAKGARDIGAAYLHGLLGWALLQQGRLPEAELHLRTAIGTAEQGHADHPYAWSSRHLLAEVLLHQGRALPAERLLRKELDVLQRNHATAWRVGRAASSLGAALLAQGKLEGAEKYLSLARVKITSRKGWPIEHENRLLVTRLEDLRAMRSQQSEFARLEK